MAIEPATIIDDTGGEPPAPPAPPPAAPPAPPPAPSPPPAGDPPAPPAGDPPAGDPPAPGADDWRARMAGDDDKLLGFLGRYQSEKAFVEAAKKDRETARTKQLLKLPDNPTPEEVAAFRKEQGIPDKADAYMASLPDGLVVGDDDKPFVDQFLTSMHGVNAPPAMVNAALETYYGIVETQAAAMADATRQAESSSIEALREEWGLDYKRNLTVMHAHLESLPPSVADAFKFGRGADGTPLGYNPDVLKWLTSLALETNPLATVVPGAGANQATAIADEIKTIEGKMRTDRAAYNKDEKMQERYRELVGARQKLEGKS